jgi:hypothetical protein
MPQGVNVDPKLKVPPSIRELANGESIVGKAMRSELDPPLAIS